MHVTLRVVAAVPSLRKELLERILRRCLVAQRTKHDEAQATQFQVVHFSIQSDHLHLIVEADDKTRLARGVAGLEIRIARRLNRVLRRRGRFWAGRYHRHDLRSPTETRNALRYVLLNSHKHHRVIGDRAFADPHSSAGSFGGFAYPAALFDELVPWSRVAPRTWLLGTGWRRQGLIDPADSPGRRQWAADRRNGQ